MSMHVDHGQQEQELITLFHSASIHNLSESAAVYGYLLHTLFHQSFYYASHLMQQGRHHAVYALLADQVALNGGSGSNHGQYKASLLFAAACIKLDKHVEAEMALQALLQPDFKDRHGIVPDIGHIHCLLGTVAKLQHRKGTAIDYFQTALSHNPYLWDAYSHLSQLGVQVSVESYLDTPPADTPAAATAAPTTGSSKNYQADLLANLQSWIAHYSDTNHNASAVLPPNQPITTTSFSRGAAQLIPKLGASASTHPPHPLSTLPLSFPAASSSSTAGSTTIKKSSATNTSSDTRKTRSNNAGSTSSTTLSSKTHQQATIAKPPAKRARTTASGSSSNAQPVGESSKAASKKSTQSEQQQPLPPPVASTHQQQPSSLSPLNTLLKTICKSYNLLCFYKCEDALVEYSKLPLELYECGWILCQIAKCYYEMGEYAESETFFERARQAEPWLQEYMDIYSAVLWHLKKGVELSYLAHELAESDKQSCQAWIAIGNTFSLQKNIPYTLKAFERALRLNPNHTYTYTLLGHEHLTSESYEKAIYYFNCAIRNDERHFNGWYGLANVYFKMDKMSYAEMYLETANKIRLCISGVGFHALIKSKCKQYRESVKYLNSAIKLSRRRNPILHFRKAQALYHLGSYQESLDELKLILDESNQEANVFFLLGKVYKHLGDSNNAMLALTMAQDLSGNKSTTLVKEAIEAIHVHEDQVE